MSFEDIIDKLSQALDSNEPITMIAEAQNALDDSQRLIKELHELNTEVNRLALKVLVKAKEIAQERN